MTTLTTAGLSENVLRYIAPHPPVEEKAHVQDRAAFANPEKISLLVAASNIKHLTPYIGTELEGVQLSELTADQKDELALLAAERGVVFFRNQNLDIDQQYTLTKHYGIMNYHSDHSFEINPPAYTMLRLVRTPKTGGDTIFTSQTALFDKLSPHFQKLFEGLQGVHSSEQGYINSLNRGTQPFRGPVRREHPLVRTHPVAHLKSLFYNPSFVIHLSGLKGQEAIHALSFLREHLHAADDLTVRWKWEPGSVAFWDNRVVVHRAVPGGYDPAEREGKRTAVYGEKPFFDPESESLSQREARTGLGARSV
ncbi:putative alpha-ketoglutarate-dependent sulfonate dioxygenase [Polychaeton citri CBS 116435]|uniref:Alpha-ketoglutarate-dependent sulfonate dioxygenase n=1 Tax=Polychaeton citri CBS 116435 TaxID=1314669 RepID=A0A9P4Q2V8_9PEZI|nr:putative alpha-ketoglutarate-dependent sulfonate dioxygenase [Polychaeton citri CBS 116435]